MCTSMHIHIYTISACWTLIAAVVSIQISRLSWVVHLVGWLNLHNCQWISCNSFRILKRIRCPLLSLGVASLWFLVAWLGPCWSCFLQWSFLSIPLCSARRHIFLAWQIGHYPVVSVVFSVYAVCWWLVLLWRWRCHPCRLWPRLHEFHPKILHPSSAGKLPVNCIIQRTLPWVRIVLCWFWMLPSIGHHLWSVRCCIWIWGPVSWSILCLWACPIVSIWAVVSNCSWSFLHLVSVRGHP